MINNLAMLFRQQELSFFIRNDVVLEILLPSSLAMQFFPMHILDRLQ